jgi:hypothetical protein
MDHVNKDNWNFCHYKNSNLTALVSFGASPEILEDKFIYYVSVIDEENNEQFQQEFDNVDTACSFINDKYAEFWDFKDLSFKEDTGGCGSCTAH